MGKTLFLDEVIQSAQIDEYVYHESLVHPSPKEVLVIGGGEGATIREVLRHSSIQNVTMVDIDKELVEICQKYLPEWSDGAFADKRTDLIFADAREFVESTEKKFDLIISDLTEPVEKGPSVFLFTIEFYEKIEGILNHDGLFVLQAGSADPFYNQFFASCAKTLEAVFSIVMSLKHGPKNSELIEIRENHSPSSGLFFKIRRQLHCELSSFQKIEVFENDFFGNILFLDGLVQTSEKDEYFYHEMFTHPAFMSHPAPEKCLIIGGGDGGTLKEVLRYPLKKAWLVEIDRRVIEVCQKYFPWLNESLKDKRTEHVTADGNEFIATTEEKFDVILIDSSEPVGPSSVLHGREFYRKLKKCLNPGGIIVAQAAPQPRTNASCRSKILHDRNP